MAQMSFIFVCVFVVIISFSEATPFGMFPKMSGFQQMGMPGFGNPLHDMMQMMMFPMMQPKPFQVTPPKDKNKLQEQMRLQQLKIEAQHLKMMLEHQKMIEAMMNPFAALAPTPLVETKPKSKSSKSKSKSKSKSSKSSKSMNSDTSARSKSRSDDDSKEIKLSLPSQLPLTMPGQMPVTMPGQMPLTAGMPGTNFQSMSYSTSSHSAHVNGVPVTASQTGQVTLNDNGKVTTHVF